MAQAFPSKNLVGGVGQKWKILGKCHKWDNHRSAVTWRQEVRRSTIGKVISVRPWGICIQGLVGLVHCITLRYWYNGIVDV